jgi:4-hydroxy-tetrahydrodipicolinate synthase
LNFFTGLWIALVTPFSGSRVDEAALRKLVRELRESGVKGFVPLGTTGEGPTLSDDERRRILKICLEEAGNVPVVPGTGTYSTEKTIRRTVEAAEIGAQGAMVITPYYNKPTQEGLLAHYRAVARATDLPLLLYNIPSRTGVNLEPETVAKLAELPTIAAIKEASGNLSQISEIHALAGDKLSILSGDDGLTLPICQVGGRGVVSVVGHILPETVIKMLDAHQRGDNTEALKYHEQLLPLCKALSLETNPAPIKAALAMLGKCSEDLRLPLVTVREETRKIIAATLEKSFGITIKGE